MGSLYVIFTKARIVGFMRASSDILLLSILCIVRFKLGAVSFTARGLRMLLLGFPPYKIFEVIAGFSLHFLSFFSALSLHS